MSKPREKSPSRAGSLPLVGGALALDFCNTSSGRGTEGCLENLNTANDLLTWARHAGVLDESRETRLLDLCGKALGSFVVMLLAVFYFWKPRIRQ